MKKTIYAGAAALAMMVASSSAQAGLFDKLCNAGCDSPCDIELACDENACDAIGGCDSICDHKGLGLLSNLKLRKSDHCFDDFISPMSNPIYFEDPRTLTELRPIFLHHALPERMGTPGIDGGEIQVLAAQIRLALTERLSLIATKDGYTWAQNSGAMSTLLNDGWADLSLGLKYNLVRDTSAGTLASAGFTYEIPLGSEETLQSIGDGEFHLFYSIAQRLLDGDAHYMGTFGWRLPVDGNVQSESIHLSNHLDVRLTDTVYAVTEIVWWHWVDEAEAGAPLGIAGQDFFNLSSSNINGEDLVTQSVGLKCKPNGNREYGLAFEFPLSGFEDILDYRIQADLIFRY